MLRLYAVLACLAGATHGSDHGSEILDHFADEYTRLNIPASVDNPPSRLEMMTAVVDRMSTADMIATGLWLTQDEIDDELGVPHHKQDGAHAGSGRRLNRLVEPYSDIHSNAIVHNGGEVYYCFDGSADSTRRSAFEKAVNRAEVEINQLGFCLTFVRTYVCDHSAITVGRYDDDSCHVASPWDGEGIKLNMGWCNDDTHLGVIVHEIGHALGLGHTHQRPDRDDYVTIHFENIDPEWKYAYEIDYDYATHLPYDYNSLMHYGAVGGFAIDPSKNAITPLDPNANIGRRTGGFSLTDARQLRDIYGCSETCCSSLIVSISGAASSNQGSREDVYTVVPGVSQGGMPVYKQGSGSSYLYYWPESTDWYIGRDYATASAGIISLDNKLQCPQQASTWAYWDSDNFVANAGVSVKCSVLDSYVLVTSGTCNDVPGRARITSAFECAQAAHELRPFLNGYSDADVTPTVQEGSASYDPPGCWFESDSLYFNPGTQTGDCSTNDKCLCRFHTLRPPSPPLPSPLPPPLVVAGGGGCSPNLDDMEYYAAGFTASGAPYYRHPSSEYYIFWDPDCYGDGSGSARWIVDSDAPSTTASSDLDGDGSCSYKARINSADSSSPPRGTNTWTVLCDGSWAQIDLTLSAPSPSPPPPPPPPPPFVVTGGCSPLLANVEYNAVGYTASGAPYYRDFSSSYYIYWDPDPDGDGSTARWIVDDDAPSTTAASDLDGDGSRIYWASISSADSSSPPLGTATWSMYCDGWTNNDLTLTSSASPSPPPPSASPSPPPPSASPSPPPSPPPAVSPSPQSEEPGSFRVVASFTATRGDLYDFYDEATKRNILEKLAELAGFAFVPLDSTIGVYSAPCSMGTCANVAVIATFPVVTQSEVSLAQSNLEQYSGAAGEDAFEEQMGPILAGVGASVETAVVVEVEEDPKPTASGSGGSPVVAIAAAAAGVAVVAALGGGYVYYKKKRRADEPSMATIKQGGTPEAANV